MDIHHIDTDQMPSNIARGPGCEHPDRFHLDYGHAQDFMKALDHDDDDDISQLHAVAETP